MSPHPHEVKFELQRKLLSLVQEDGKVPMITSIHSVAAEGNTVFVGYDLLTADPGDILFFEFERPQLVGPYEIDDFARWLAWSDLGETMH
jgi:hypothetical protein